LSLERLLELTVGRIRDRGGEFAGNLTDTVASNPVPMLLTSIGVGWMMLASKRSNGAGHHGDTGGAFAAARDRAAGAADATRETVEDAADSLRAGASRMSATAREGLSSAQASLDHARERMDRLVHEQPLILGALGIAAGALIGALLPVTDAEDQLIGKTRDDAVRNMARTNRARYEAARRHASVYSAPNGDDGGDERPIAIVARRPDEVQRRRE
jgi:hypothetical protein